MRSFEFITEALKPSEYRSIVKGWDNQRLADIFQKWPGEKNRTATRLYFNFPQSQNIDPVKDLQVVDKLKQLGYDVIDYPQGLAKKITAGNQNPTKIGKILATAAKQGDEQAKSIFQKFQNDTRRAYTKTEYMGVISRHPYDIAGQSTGRGWTTCRHLDDQGLGIIPLECKVGTLVAYMIKKGDLDIKSPAGRMLIHPYMNQKKQIAYGVNENHFTGGPQEFVDAVHDFTDWINNQNGVTGLFATHPDLAMYSYDPDEEIAVISPTNSEAEILDMVKNNYLSIKKVFKAGIKPSKKIMMAAIEWDRRALKHIINAGIKPDEEIMMAAVKVDSNNLKYIIDAGIKPSEQVKAAHNQKWPRTPH